MTSFTTQILDENIYNLNDDKFCIINLPNKIIENNYLEVGIRYSAGLDSYLPNDSTIKYLSDNLLITIDDSLYSDIEWMRWDSKQRVEEGITTMLDISSFKNGKHYLNLRFKSIDSLSLEHFNSKYNTYKNIPFWKDVR